MRIFGWIFGGLFLLDGMLALIGKRALVKRLDTRIGRRLPARIGRKLHRATALNNTAVTAWGINNVLAGVGMLLVAALVGLGRRTVEITAVEA